MFEKIEELLKEKIGLDISSIGVLSVESAIKRSLASSEYDDLTQYFEVLLSSDAEFKRLVEMVVVPETWFFRDDIPFEVLANRVRSHWLQSGNTNRMLKVLSMPCSTGEEPYTIAMVLDRIGFPGERMQIDAMDISQHSIDKAIRGIYRENSFRSENLSFRDYYFTTIADGYRLKSRIRKRVCFKQGNLLKDDFAHLRGHYDVIFCRNLLIYFDSKDQQYAVNELSKMLAPDGTLFVGHAEANNNLNQQFCSLRLRGAFAFMKKNSEDVVVDRDNYGEKFHEFSRKHSAISSGGERDSGDHLAGGAVIRPFSTYLDHNKLEINKDEKMLISKARSLADEGSLESAEELCHEIISRFSSADGYYLLGVIYEASNRQQEAGAMFRKTIYLVPDHAEALVHLALHVERDGNETEALSLRRRAERASE